MTGGERFTLGLIASAVAVLFLRSSSAVEGWSALFVFIHFIMLAVMGFVLVVTAK